VRFSPPDREGVMFSPPVGDPYTSFSAWVSKLDESIVAEDLDDLRAGVNEGLTELPECQVEAGSESVLSNLIKFERVFTFREDGATRKRKVWLLYVDTWLIVLTWQGSSPDEYAYWLPMANYSFATFNLPEALWFATDRDLGAYKR
jgi:hypothetical protein